MKKQLQRSLICVLFLVAFVLTAALTAVHADPAEPTLTVKYYNLNYSQYTFVMYAVGAENVPEPEEIKMLFWAAPRKAGYTVGTEAYSTDWYGAQTIKGDECQIFHSGGISPKKLIDTQYCRAYVQIDGVDMSMNASTVYATADTPEGGQVQYKIAMNRDGIGWKINGVDLYFASQN